MSGMPMVYCLRCAMLRPVASCAEREDELVIRLDECGHVILRTVSLEWFVESAGEPARIAAAPGRAMAVASRF